MKKSIIIIIIIMGWHTANSFHLISDSQKKAAVQELLTLFISLHQVEIFHMSLRYLVFLNFTHISNMTQNKRGNKYIYSSTNSLWGTLCAWFIFRDCDDLDTNCVFSAVLSVALRFGHFSYDVDRLLIEARLPLLFLLSSSILFVWWHLKNHHLLFIIQTPSCF